MGWMMNGIIPSPAIKGVLACIFGLKFLETQNYLVYFTTVWIKAVGNRKLANVWNTIKSPNLYFIVSYPNFYVAQVLYAISAPI